MAVSGVFSSCDTLATKSRRMSSSRRSWVTSLKTTRTPIVSAPAPCSGVLFTFRMRSPFWKTTMSSSAAVPLRSERVTNF